MKPERITFQPSLAKRWLTYRRWVIAASTLLAMSACGGGGGSTPTNEIPSISTATVSGRIADGYITGAYVFWDCNNNLTLDAGELKTTSGANGKYTLTGTPIPMAGLTACTLRAEIPPTAIDEDTGQSLGRSLLLSSIDNHPEFISPLTTLVAMGVYTENDLLSKLGNANLPITFDYIAAGASGASHHTAAKYVSEVLKQVSGQIRVDDTNSRKNIIELALINVPVTAWKGLPGSEDAFADFKTKLPSREAINYLSASLSPARFELEESAFSGEADPRRAVVQLAIDLLRKHPEAITGNRIHWEAISQVERAKFGSDLANQTLFPPSEESKAILDQILALTAKAIDEIESKRKSSRKEAFDVLIKGSLELTATSIKSAAILVPYGSKIKKIGTLSNFKKLRSLAEKGKPLVEKSKLLMRTSACANISSDISLLIVAGDLSGESNDWADRGVHLSGCVAALIGGKDFQNIYQKLFEGANSVGNAAALTLTDEKELVEILSVLSDLTSTSLDIAGLSIPAAIMDEIGIMIKGVKLHYDIQAASDKGDAQFEIDSDAILNSFKNIAGPLGPLLTSARLNPYIRIKPPLDVSEESTKIIVGSPVYFTPFNDSTLSVSYTWNFGDMTDDITTDAPIKQTHIYDKPGTYAVTLTLNYKNFDGTSPVERMKITREVIVSALPQKPSYSITFTDLAGASQAGWVVSPTVSFIDGKNGGKAAKFGGTASPGQIRIPNNDQIKFSGEATFDFWARIDSDTGMDGYGQTVTGQFWVMSLLAKSHDRNGVALESGRGGGLGLGSFDSSWAVAQGSCSYPMTAAPGRSAGVWYRITATMSSTAGTRMYINGQLYEDCPTRRNSFAQMNTQDLYIGTFSDYWYPLDGAIQDVRIYQKALSEAEVKALQ